MLTKVFELNEGFYRNRQVRIAVYISALLLTMLNYRILFRIPAGGIQLFMIIAAALPTILIYYISGGFSACYIVVRSGAGIINIFFLPLVLFCPFAAPLLMFFSAVFSLMICACAAYALPVLLVPVVGIIRKYLIYENRYTS